MCKAREAIATTSLVGVSESEKGLLGSEIVTGGLELERWWIWRVESQEAEIRMLWARA